MRQEVDRRLQEKEEEFDHSKKNHLRAMDSMQASLEAESRAKDEALRIKKKLESDINEMEIALDHANKAHAEAKKAIKRTQNNLAEVNQVRELRRLANFAAKVPPFFVTGHQRREKGHERGEGESGFDRQEGERHLRRTRGIQGAVGGRHQGPETGGAGVAGHEGPGELFRPTSCHFCLNPFDRSTLGCGR